MPDFELDQYARKTRRHFTFSKEARREFLDFTLAPSAAWKGKFRDLNAAVARMSTLSAGGRISLEAVGEEIERLAASWGDPSHAKAADRLTDFAGPEAIPAMDLFDRAQLNQVLEVCLRSRSLSEARRMLFGASRDRKTTSNDADRLRKYLGRFGIEWAQIAEQQKVLQ